MQMYRLAAWCFLMRSASLITMWYLGTEKKGFDFIVLSWLLLITCVIDKTSNFGNCSKSSSGGWGCNPLCGLEAYFNFHLSVHLLACVDVAALPRSMLKGGMTTHCSAKRDFITKLMNSANLQRTDSLCLCYHSDLMELLQVSPRRYDEHVHSLLHTESILKEKKKMLFFFFFFCMQKISSQRQPYEDWASNVQCSCLTLFKIRGVINMLLKKGCGKRVGKVAFFSHTPICSPLPQESIVWLHDVMPVWSWFRSHYSCLETC